MSDSKAKTLATLQRLADELDNRYFDLHALDVREWEEQLTEKWVSEAEHKKLETLLTKYNEEAVVYEEKMETKVKALEAEHKRICGNLVKEIGRLEGENKNLQEVGKTLANLNFDVQKERNDLRERLSDIRKPEMLEKLAELEHEQWCTWINYVEDLKVIINVPVWDAWVRLAKIPYAKLTEKGKDSDRRFARKVLGVLLNPPKNEGKKCLK